MKKIDGFNFSGHRALTRVDFNVRYDEQYEMIDDSRVRGAAPTIRKILDDGGSVVLMSHLGRPTHGQNPKTSLAHIVPHLAEMLKCKVHFANDCVGHDAAKLSENLPPGEVLLLENLRFHVEETKCDSAFAEALASHGDVFVNDAFGVAHRAHASNFAVANYFSPDKKMFGYLIETELENARQVMENQRRPYVAIVGGAKIADKILVITRLIDHADSILFGGGMAFTMLKAQGASIGQSMVDEKSLDKARSLIDLALIKDVKIVLPEDTIAATEITPNAKPIEVASQQIPDDLIGLDIGPKAAATYAGIIARSNMILWNGTMGVYELPQFMKGTQKIVEAITEATKNGAYSLVGGGDTVAALSKLNMKDKVSFASTGGGALLHLFEGKELPGVVAITG